MKIRRSFVTNSSSCAFVLIGKPEEKGFKPSPEEYDDYRFFEGPNLYIHSKNIIHLLDFGESDYDETPISELINKINNVDPELIKDCKIITGFRLC